MAKTVTSRQPSARESAAAAAVCVALGAMLGWLIHIQAQFSPAVTVALNATAAASTSAASKPAAAIPDLVATWPATLKPMSAAEEFSAATLSDKIDGKAEVYLAAGVAGMKCQRVALTAAPASWLELFVFDMGKPANAFSVFSSQKRSDVTDLALGDYSYRAGNQFAFVHGQFYVELIGTDETAATIDAATSLAKVYLTATAVATHANVSVDAARFPQEGLIAGSVMLLSADVFGFDGLKDVFVAHYRDGTDEFTLFVAQRANATEATTAATALRGFFVTDCGGKEVAPAPSSPAGAVIIDGGGTFDGVFTTGAFLAGVHQAPSREAAERWLARLAQHLATKGINP
jgi:hypothetical protein